MRTKSNQYEDMIEETGVGMLKCRIHDVLYRNKCIMCEEERIEKLKNG